VASSGNVTDEVVMAYIEGQDQEKPEITFGWGRNELPVGLQPRLLGALASTAT